MALLVRESQSERAEYVQALKDQNQALLGKIDSLNAENQQLQSSQDAQYKVLFEKINQLSNESQQDRVLKWVLEFNMDKLWLRTVREQSVEP